MAKIEDLISEANAHRALNHPYLFALKNGEFNNMESVLKDLALQYGFYSSWFQKYLTAAISKLDNPQHRNLLLENLAEERGHLHDEDIEQLEQLGIEENWVQGIPHPELFLRFQHAIDVDTVNASPSVEVQIWRESFLELIENGNHLTAIGAIGIGTESVVKFIYRHIIESIENFTDLSLKEYVFFPLHTEVDDEHGLILSEIAEELITGDPGLYDDLRKGVIRSLNLRAAFWDGMLERARIIDGKLNSVNLTA